MRTVTVNYMALVPIHVNVTEEEYAKIQSGDTNVIDDVLDKADSEMQGIAVMRIERPHDLDPHSISVEGEEVIL